MEGSIHLSHFDYVKLPNGMKKRIFGLDDVESVQAEWGDYIERNWISPQQKMFAPESKVKFMLEGLANIILRPDMSGLLTEYQKMKIAKYEIPLSSCAPILEDTLYSRHVKKDNGEEKEKLEMYMEDAARKFDEAKAARLKNQPSKKKPKTFPPTRRQKIESVRKDHNITKFKFCRVDTENVFCYGDWYFQIPKDNEKYAGKVLKDGDVIYDMDCVLCAETSQGELLFFDMDIAPINGVLRIGEQINFL